MSNYFIKNIPSIRKHEFKYRSKINSHDLNEVQEQSLNDILDLFNKANALQKTIYELQNSHELETFCYEQRLNVAITKLNELEENYHNLLNPETDFRTKTVYAYNAYTFDDVYGAIINKNSNTITPYTLNSISKVRMYDETYGEYLVPDSLQAFVGPDDFTVGGNIYSIEDSEIKNAFDGSKDTTWLRKITTSTNVNSIENEIVIALPEDIITSRLINEITINPFPSGMIDIMGVYYKSNGSWTLIPGFENYYNYTSETIYDIFNNPHTSNYIKEACDLRFNFKEVQTNQIKIKFRQNNFIYDEENDKRMFYIGLRDFNASYNTYSNDPSTFDMIFDFTELNNNIKIYDIDITFNNSNISEDENFGITKEFFYFDSNDISHKIGESCPFILKGHKLRVQFKTDGSQIAPNVRCATVRYKLS